MQVEIYGYVQMFFMNREYLKNNTKLCFLKVLSLVNDISGVQMSLTFIEEYELVSSLWFRK